MAPHVTELLFAAGGGERIVGVVSHSVFPETAKLIALIGDNRNIDMERVIALKPDLIVVWRHGSSERQIEQLRTLNIPIFHSEAQSLDATTGSLQRLGPLMATEKEAEAAAAALKGATLDGGSGSFMAQAVSQAVSSV